MYKSKLLVLTIAIIVIGCKEKSNKTNNDLTDNNVNYDKSLKVVDSLSIEIDNEISFMYNNTQIIKRNDETIALIGDLNNNGFFEINLEQEKLGEKYYYNATGPNGLGSNRNGNFFYYHNADTIFVFGKQSKKIFLTNSELEIKNVYDLPSIANFELGELIVSTTRPVKYNNKEKTLSFVTYPTTAAKITNSAEDPISVSFSIEKKTLLKSEITYSKTNQKNNHPIYVMPTVLFLNDKEIVLFPFDSKFYFNDGNGWNTKDFKSDYINSYTPMEGDLSKMRQYDVEGSYNFYLLSNDQDEYIYLISEIGIPFINNNTGEKNLYEEKPFSVMVFDKNLNKISENKFPGGIYKTLNAFVANGGLYLSKNNPINSEFEENKYKYDFLKVL